jgi:hypothetical protein
MNDWERMLFETYFECARQGQLYENRYASSLSVVPQQIYSYLYQRRRIGTTIGSLYGIFSPVYDEEEVKTVFRKLHDDQKVEATRPGIFFDSSKLEKQIDWGKIHSNIAETSFGEYDVFNVTTGISLGRIFHLREKFVLGGKCWQIVQIVEKDKKVYAKYAGDASVVTKIFEGKGAGSYNYLLAPVIKAKSLPNIAPHEFPYAVEGRNTHILHLFGSLYGFIIADGLFEDGVDAMDVDGKMLVLNGLIPTDDGFPVPSVDAIRKVIGENIARLEDALGSGAYFYDLPRAYQVEDHFANMDILGFLEFLTSLRLVNIELSQFKQIAESLK